MSEAAPLFGGLGVLLGLRHALEPDHLAAVATLVTRQRSLASAASLGLAWGIGHAGMLLTVVTIVSLGVVVPPTVTIGAELVVAGLMVVLGFGALGRARHVAAGNIAQAPADAVRSLGFGLLHGLAGGGVVAALLLAAMPTFAMRISAAAAFGGGTMLGMVAASGVLAGAARLAPHSRNHHRRLHVVAGAASIAVGLALGVKVLYHP